MIIISSLILLLIAAILTYKYLKYKESTEKKLSVYKTEIQKELDDREKLEKEYKERIRKLQAMGADSADVAALQNLATKINLLDTKLKFIEQSVHRGNKNVMGQISLLEKVILKHMNIPLMEIEQMHKEIEKQQAESKIEIPREDKYPTQEPIKQTEEPEAEIEPIDIIQKDKKEMIEEEEKTEKSEESSVDEILQENEQEENFIEEESKEKEKPIEEKTIEEPINEEIVEKTTEGEYSKENDINESDITQEEIEDVEKKDKPEISDLGNDDLSDMSAIPEIKKPEDEEDIVEEETVPIAEETIEHSTEDLIKEEKAHPEPQEVQEEGKTEEEIKKEEEEEKKDEEESNTESTNETFNIANSEEKIIDEEELEHESTPFDDKIQNLNLEEMEHDDTIDTTEEIKQEAQKEEKEDQTLSKEEDPEIAKALEDLQNIRNKPYFDNQKKEAQKVVESDDEFIKNPHNIMNDTEKALFENHIQPEEKDSGLKIKESVEELKNKLDLPQAETNEE